MFELEECTEESVVDVLGLMMDENQIDMQSQILLRPVLQSLLDTNKTEFETSVSIFVALYVAKEFELEAWPVFLTCANIGTFVNDSVLIMCSEGEFMNSLPWVKNYDLFGNFLSFLSEQFINIFEA